MTAKISPELKTLLREPAYAQLATVMPNGSPQLTQVWVDTDGEHVLVNTADDRQKVRNVERDSRVAVNVHDPENAWRIASVRGRVADVTTEGADDLIDQLAQKYLDEERYPFRQPDETRVTLVIEPESVNATGLE